MTNGIIYFAMMIKKLGKKIKCNICYDQSRFIGG